ncbi:RagB/SusD family nutrient uptake outer membrane protein [uncultured Prevotella sp.]|uniref:RagB/SusD family nutrient uptake outer membrane protein n=1 Tax=uncultured Prevotella sp. TaxID=159272 RepID=UPI00258A6164|nr:RagB/SusD family nutrient uptake outer membrane protein [uncultured Prevotella sp.]
MKKNYNKIICAICVVCGLTSCSDFLDIKPQNEIIFEDFWNEKADVDNVVAGCYSALQNDGVRKRMMIWGEARTENVMAGQGINNDINLSNILKENITAMNTYTTWEGFYDVINRCNTVLKYAPGVAEKDPAFTQGDLDAVIAEVTALRSLSYFYLIRTFRDVPFSREAFTDDDQTMDLPATPFYEVLDNLIGDLRSVEDKAVKRYPETKTYYQTGRITQDAIRAMLCEMYLWKGAVDANAYDSCVYYAEQVIQSKRELNEENQKKNKLSADTKAALEVRLNGYPLANDNLTGTYFGQAYEDIFVDGASKETIFELVYDREMAGNGMMANSAVSSLYGNSNGTGLLVGSKYIKEDIEADYSKREIFEPEQKHKLDARLYINCDGTKDNSPIMKLASRDIEIDAKTATPKMDNSLYPQNNNSSMWIIYRLPDIMLMEAEALCEKMMDPIDGEDTEVSEHNKPLIEKAFTLVNVINKRSICKKELTASDTLKSTSYTTKTAMTDLVKRERQRELMFEGKRWYDLVRYALRAGDTSPVINAVMHREDVNKEYSQNFFKKMDAIFWPYNIEEMKVNRNLVANPAFGSGENSSYEKAK